VIIIRMGVGCISIFRLRGSKRRVTCVLFFFKPMELLFGLASRNNDSKMKCIGIVWRLRASRNTHITIHTNTWIMCLMRKERMLA
jgi:hypothetical protein